MAGRGQDGLLDDDKLDRQGERSSDIMRYMCNKLDRQGERSSNVLVVDSFINLSYPMCSNAHAIGNVACSMGDQGDDKEEEEGKNEDSSEQDAFADDETFGLRFEPDKVPRCMTDERLVARATRACDV